MTYDRYRRLARQHVKACIIIDALWLSMFDKDKSAIPSDRQLRWASAVKNRMSSAQALLLSGRRFDESP